jgi:hypothetical protein
MFMFSTDGVLRLGDASSVELALQEFGEVFGEADAAAGGREDFEAG